MIDRTWGFRLPSLAGGRVLNTVHLPAYSLFIFIDVEGNAWISAWDGVQCSYAGRRTHRQRFAYRKSSPIWTFAGKRNNRLFITATTRLYAVFLNVAGVNFPFQRSHPTRGDSSCIEDGMDGGAPELIGTTI